MKRRIVVSPAADVDIDEQFDYLSFKADIETANRFFEATQSTFQRLARMPRIGSLATMIHPRLESMRWWPVKRFENYLIFYMETDEAIYVVRLLHRSRDIESVFSSEN